MTSLLLLLVLTQSAEIIYEENPKPAQEQAAPGTEAQPNPDAQTAPGADAVPPSETPTEKESSSLEGQDLPEAQLSIPPEPKGRGLSLFRGAIELTAFSLPSGTPGGRQDLYANVLPIIAVDTGDHFGFELGATLRLRAFDDPPLQREEDLGGVLRGRDWDERSDFGQILRELRLFSNEAPVQLRAGPQFLLTLGQGHLVNRYANRGNPDYHPAGATLSSQLGAFRAEVMASDILAARLFAADVSADIGELIGAAPEHRGRYHAGVSAAHDFGGAGGVTEPITLLELSGDAAIYRAEDVQSFAYLGLGTRMLTDFGFGVALGAAVDAAVGDTSQVGVKAELRKVGGSFRFGMFGPAYELARFSDVGFGFDGVAQARLPDTFSAYGELQFAIGAFDAPGMSKASSTVFSAAAEYFLHGRLDVDAAVSSRLGEGLGALTARFTGVDLLGAAPRYQGAGELRVRFLPSLYAIAQGGVVFFPQPDRSLVRGIFAGVGVGADFSH